MPPPLPLLRTRPSWPPKILLLSGFLPALATALGGTVPKSGAPLEGQKVLALLERHCADCHDADTHKGDFRLDQLRADLGTTPAPDAAKHWGRVLARVEAGEMPPPKKERPPLKDTEQIQAWTKRTLAQEIKLRRQDGRGRMRRLNRLEYENTLHDMLGITTPLQDMLPLDEEADGFDTSAAALSISPVHIQRYMDAAEAALRAVAVRALRPASETRRFVFADEITDDPQKSNGSLTHGSNKPVIQIRDGRLVFFTAPHIEVPIRSDQFAKSTKERPGLYKVRVSAFTHDGQGEGLVYSLRSTLSKKSFGYFDAPAEGSAVAEIQHWFGPGDNVIIDPYRLNQARVKRKLGYYPPKPPAQIEGLGLGIDWIELEGPLDQEWPPAGHQVLFGNTPLKPFKELPKEIKGTGEFAQPRNTAQLTPMPEDTRAAAKELLPKFVARAFRRPVSTDEVAPFLEVANRQLDANECFEAAMRQAYLTVLCSPDFLFLVEPTGRLDNHALASRLSYFLTRSAPDEGLRHAAERGTLSNPKVLKAETERLLASARSRAFIHDFLDHWLHLRDLDATMPDKELFPEFYSNRFSSVVDGLLRESIAAETRLCFADLLEHNGSLLKLIDSDATFLNNRLAEFYGLPPVAGSGMRKVQLPADSPRGGVLTQASVLKVTANGSRTSPVLRGAWVLDNILGRPPSPPPPNVGSIEPDTRGATTVREQLSKHQSSESCASCHRQIDPPGFAMEAFDPIGQWRENYRTTETGTEVKTLGDDGAKFKYRIGQRVDASGVLSDKQAFAGPGEFKKLALQQKEAIARCLAGKLVTYSTGTRTEPGDIAALDAIVAAAQKQGYGLRTLLHEVIQSELFLSK